MDFKDQWDASEDTSVDLNPLFSQRKDPKLLFGKGSIGGVDPALQGTRSMDTAMRNFMLKKESIETKSKEVFSDRDWRILRENNGILIKGGHCPKPIREWKDLPDLPREVRYNLEDNGFTKPMPIQMQAVPIGMSMRDMIGLAPTGSGKSAAFLLPLISFLMR
jgi:ATP-dependent RNA helicase DDX23/PRP28